MAATGGKVLVGVLVIIEVEGEDEGEGGQIPKT